MFENKVEQAGGRRIAFAELGSSFWQRAAKNCSNCLPQIFLLT